MQRLAARLRKLRDENGITNKDIVERTGLSDSTVRRLFNGEGPSPILETLLAVLRAMNCKLSDLDDDGVPESGSPKVSSGSSPAEKPMMSIEDMEQWAAPYKRHIEDLQRSRRKLFIACCVLVSFIFVILLVDLCNPMIGFLRT